ncbi:MAG: hypothetical protein RLO52_47240 [Sandaracinaceae bacterium]
MRPFFSFSLGLLACSLVALPALANPPAPAVREADVAVHDATLAGRRLLHVLDQTRRSGDPTRVRCVDVRLAQVNSFQRMLGERRARLLSAMERGDAEGTRHERFVIRTMHRQLRALERAGRACVMPEVETDGRTVVEVIIGPEVPDEDPSVLSEEERRRR